jgi:pyruvate-ferredoxin/flavodoxin oxidoreductase
MKAPSELVEKSMYQENRFKILMKSKPEIAQQLLMQAQREVNTRWGVYQYLASK